MMTNQTPKGPVVMRWHVAVLMSCGVMLLGILGPPARGQLETHTYAYLSPSEIRALSVAGQAGCDWRCGEAWEATVQAALTTPKPPDLEDQDEHTGNFALAKALVSVRLSVPWLRDQVAVLLQQVVGTERGARALAVGRNLASYIIAADIIDLRDTYPTFDEQVFRPWLRSFEHRDLDGRTLRSCQEDRPNNWGTHCGASRLAIAAYLDDRLEIVRASRVFRGYLGERESYADFSFGSDAFGWMSDPTCPPGAQYCRPRPINPPGARRAGHNVDGVLVDDQRRSGRFSWPPKYTVYSYGGLEGAVVQAVMLERLGFAPWTWGDQALRRAVEWLYDDQDGKTKWDTCKDDDKRFILDLVDDAYGTNFIDRMDCRPAPSPQGRNIAWTSWTHRHTLPVPPSSSPPHVP